MNDALRTARIAAVDGFEVRRELLSAAWSSRTAGPLRDRLAAFPAPPAYSVPQPLFTGGYLEREGIQHALVDAHALGCRLVKFQPGSGTATRDDVVALAGLLADWRQSVPDLVTTVENDQQPESANLRRWERLFDLIEQTGCALSMTFDLGNWTCVGADPMAAARLLAPHVTYVHLKAVERRGGQWVTRAIGPATAVHPILAALPSAVPRAIEFPVAGGGQVARARALRQYVAWIRAGKFVA